MPNLSQFFVLHSIEKWFEMLQEPCKNLYLKYYNAHLLQRKTTHKDIYNDTWLKVIENIELNKINFENDSIIGKNNQLWFRLYFMTVYKNLLMATYEKWERMGKFEGLTDFDIVQENSEADIPEASTTEAEIEKQRENLWKAFERLGDKCKELLTAKYLGSEKMSAEEIAAEFGLKSAKRADNDLYDCRGSLRRWTQRLWGGARAVIT